MISYKSAMNPVTNPYLPWLNHHVSCFTAKWLLVKYGELRISFRSTLQENEMNHHSTLITNH